MNILTELPLRQDAPLAYRAVGSAAPSRLLLLRHGAGGNETTFPSRSRSRAMDLFGCMRDIQERRPARRP